MSDSSQNSDSVPTEFAQTNPPRTSDYDQMQVMQSLIEIQGDIKVLCSKTDRLIADVEKSDEHIDKIRSKIGRAEGFGIASIILLAAFGGFVWWLIGGQINNLRDEIIQYQQIETPPATQEKKPQS